MHHRRLKEGGYRFPCNRPPWRSQHYDPFSGTQRTSMREILLMQRSLTLKRSALPLAELKRQTREALDAAKAELEQLRGVRERAAGGGGARARGPRGRSLRPMQPYTHARV